LFEHPFEPGNSSAIEPGPWHYGADYVAVYFKGEPVRLQKLLPPPFKVADGTCIAYVCEIISVSERKPGAVAEEPARTIYNEAAVGVKCTHGEKGGVFYPVMWVTTEFSLLRGLLNGYPKRLADEVAMSKLHPLNPGMKPMGAGTELSGYCVKGGERVLTVRVNVEKRGEPKDLLAFGSTFGMRRLPRTDPSQHEVGEAVEVVKSNARTSDVWLGSGTISTVLDVGMPKPLFGAAYRSGFTISGSRVLKG
jgi:Acetoacetate decarboxylase (ADC)